MIITEQTIFTLIYFTKNLDKSEIYTTNFIHHFDSHFVKLVLYKSWKESMKFQVTGDAQ